MASFLTAVAVFARYNLLQTLDGANVVRVDAFQTDDGMARNVYFLSTAAPGEGGRAVDWAVSWQKTGLITINDANQSGVIELRNDGGQFAEATIDRVPAISASRTQTLLSPGSVYRDRRLSRY